MTDFKTSLDSNSKNLGGTLGGFAQKLKEDTSFKNAVKSKLSKVVEDKDGKDSNTNEVSVVVQSMEDVFSNSEYKDKVLNYDNINAIWGEKSQELGKDRKNIVEDPKKILGTWVNGQEGKSLNKPKRQAELAFYVAFSDKGNFAPLQTTTTIAKPVENTAPIVTKDQVVSVGQNPSDLEIEPTQLDKTNNYLGKLRSGEFVILQKNDSDQFEVKAPPDHDRITTFKSVEGFEEGGGKAYGIPAIVKLTTEGGKVAVYRTEYEKNEDAPGNKGLPAWLIDINDTTGTGLLDGATYDPKTKMLTLIKGDKSKTYSVSDASKSASNVTTDKRPTTKNPATVAGGAETNNASTNAATKSTTVRKTANTNQEKVVAKVSGKDKPILTKAGVQFDKTDPTKVNPKSSILLGYYARKELGLGEDVKYGTELRREQIEILQKKENQSKLQKINAYVSDKKNLEAYGYMFANGGSYTGKDVDKIRAIQTKLGVTSDGVYGPDTEAKVLAYQDGKGIKEDGICGPETLTKLVAQYPDLRDVLKA